MTRFFPLNLFRKKWFEKYLVLFSPWKIPKTVGNSLRIFFVYLLQLKHVNQIIVVFDNRIKTKCRKNSISIHLLLFREGSAACHRRDGRTNERRETKPTRRCHSIRRKGNIEEIKEIQNNQPTINYLKYKQIIVSWWQTMYIQRMYVNVCVCVITMDTTVSLLIGEEVFASVSSNA